MRNWEKGSSDMALYGTNRELESQRLELHQVNQWADQAQRDKIVLYGELELRNGLFLEDHARGCQEIEELRRICCEETEARIEELSFEESYDSESDDGSNSGFTEQSKFFVRCNRISRS